MSEIKISVNGLITGADQAVVPVLDRGFLYGDSVFEVYRTYDGRPFCERAHLQRLAQSAQRLMIQMPVSEEALAAEVKALLDAADLPNAYLRIVITRGTGPLTYDPSAARDPMRVIIAAPVNPPPAQVYESGVQVTIARASRPTDDVRAQGAKASNYLANLLVVHEAKQRGAAEAILIGRDGQLLEGASSNIFVVKDGTLRTPEPQPGILVGITRGVVIELAQEEGLQVQEGALYPDDLFEADEAFITSSIREIVPVVGCDGRRIAAGTPGAATKRLLAGYRARALGAAV